MTLHGCDKAPGSTGGPFTRFGETESNSAYRLESEFLVLVLKKSPHHGPDFLGPPALLQTCIAEVFYLRLSFLDNRCSLNQSLHWEDPLVLPNKPAPALK